MRYIRERIEAHGRHRCRRASVKPIEIKAPAARNVSRMRSTARAAARRRPPRRSSRVLKSLLKDPELGKLVVPIIPDEARTFGMESLFREYGIYASQGQLYKPRGCERSAVLQGSAERPDSGGRHHRSGIHGLLHRGRHGLRQLRRADDSVLIFTIRCSASSASAT